MSRRTLLLALLGATACGGVESEATSGDRLVGGSNAGTAHSEVGKLWFDGAYCTATLIRPDVAITAAHCVEFRTGEARQGSIELSSANGDHRAQVIGFRSFGSRLGLSDVALIRLESPVPSRIATPAEVATTAPRVGDSLLLFGYGCDDRNRRVSAGRTSRRVTFGSSAAVCPGDSGGPGFLSNGKIGTITSGYLSGTAGDDVFAYPAVLRTQIDAQIVEWGGVASAPTGSGALPNARIWQKDGSLGRCAEWPFAENFASGRYNAHRFHLSVPAGDSRFEVSVAGGAWQPLLVLAQGETKIYEGQGTTSAGGVDALEITSGRTGRTAAVAIHTSTPAVLDVYLTSWAVRDSAYSTSLPRDAAYRFAANNLCSTPPSTSPRIDRFPFSVSGDTKTGRSVVSNYACAPDTNESGPELSYDFDLTEEGYVALELSSSPAGVDVDVHLLRTDGACLSRGNLAAGALLGPGRYKVVVDSWVGRDGVVRSGRFDLSGGFTSARALQGFGVSVDASRVALKAFSRAFSERATESFVYSIADYSQLSNARRFFVVDLVRQQLSYSVLVAHGAGSSDPTDSRRVRSVSNDATHSTSVGLYVVGGLESGELGLTGIEPSFNDAAERRGLVVTGDPDVSMQFVADHGAPSLSDGSFLVGSDVAAGVTGRIMAGTLLLSYFADARWLSESEYLR